MPTMAEMLRLQNIFGAPSGPTALPTTGPASITTPPLVKPGDDPYSNITFGNTDMSKAPTSNIAINDGSDGVDGTPSIAQRMGQLFQPHTQSIDNLNDMISQYPRREDYKPSVMRRIGAALTMFGRGGPNMAQQVFDKPFNDAVTDWQAKIKPMEQAANLERYQNTNERLAAYQTVANELRQRAQDLKDKNDTINAQIREHRASVYEFKATHPGAKLIFTKGGNVQAFDPITQQTADLGIPTGSMTELDKLNLQFEEQMKEIGERGAQQRTTEGVKETNRQADIAARGAQSRQTKEVVPGGSKGGAGKPETPTQTRVRQFNAARELYNSRPELRPFIKLGAPSNNDFTITPPSESKIWGHTGPTKEQYAEIQSKIYGNTTPAPAASHSSAGNAPPIPAGRVAIMDNTGKVIGTIPDTPEQRALAEKSQYKVVESKK